MGVHQHGKNGCNNAQWQNFAIFSSLTHRHERELPRHGVFRDRFAIPDPKFQWRGRHLASIISREKIKDIQNASDILEVVSERVALKKAGKNWLGLCPFHTEKTPSFTVSPEKKIYHCFGCGAGGDVFRFLMTLDGLTFPEAVRLLAARHGIDLPDESAHRGSTKVSEKDRLLQINAEAMRFYQRQLLEADSGKRAKAYLIQRGMSRKIIDAFCLGYAPDSWDSLIRHFQSTQIDSQWLEQAGLAVPRKKGGGHYDRFRNRIMFPIFDLYGKVIAFGGRVLDDALPKYLNSSETPIYQKSKSLYGIQGARATCRQTASVFIVEGYFDLLTLHQHGIENAVATLGTALTADHVKQLRADVGESGHVVLVYDSDEAGIKAAQRSIAVFREGFLAAKIVVLPSGYDPDSYLMEKGPDAFLKTTRQALGVMPFLMERAVAKYGLEPEGKVRIMNEMQTTVAAVGDPVERTLYIQQLAERLQIDESIVLQRIQQAAPAVSDGRGRHGSISTTRHPRTGADKGSEAASGTMLMPGQRLERHIISMLLQYPEIIDEMGIGELLDQFEDTHLKSIGFHIIEMVQNGSCTVDELMSRAENHQEKAIIAALALKEETWNRQGCLKLIEQFRRAKRRRCNNLLQRIKAAEESNDLELLQDLLREKQLESQK
jgi:DNA primase